MELRQLRYFIAIAEEQGFHKAARRLHIAQPALSACVKQLEDEIGHRLLERSKHRVALTAAGVELLDEARRLVAAERSAKEAVRSAAASARFAARMQSTRCGDGAGAFGLRQSSGALDAAAHQRESGRGLPHSKTRARLPGHGFISSPPPRF
jgi:DNA-binding transcriptional LysR family regulator